MVHLYSAYPMALALYNGNKTHMSIYIYIYSKHQHMQLGTHGGYFVLYLAVTYRVTDAK